MITARDIARFYTQSVCAYWRGDNEFLGELDGWLARFWTDCPVKPVTNPAAVCPHGAAGRGIHWYDTRSGVLGYVPGEFRCYHIPPAAVLPDFTGQSAAIAMQPIAA